MVFNTQARPPRRGRRAPRPRLRLALARVAQVCWYLDAFCVGYSMIASGIDAQTLIPLIAFPLWGRGSTSRCCSSSAAA